MTVVPETAPIGSPHPAAPEVDVLVVGAGIVGTSLGGYLAKDGLSVAVIDAGRPAGSFANAGSLQVQMEHSLFKGWEISLGLYKEATKFWMEFQAELGIDCEARISGGLMVGESEAELAFLRRKVAKERELGLDVAFLDRGDLDRVAPYLGPNILGAEFCAHDGKVNPLLANPAAATWARKAGAVFLKDDPVVRIKPDCPGFSVSTTKGVIRAGKIALAAGHGSRPLAAQLGFDLPAYPTPLHMNITESTEPFIEHLITHASRHLTLKQFHTGQAVIGGGWPAMMGESGGIPTVKLSSIVGNLSLAQHVLPQLAQLRVIRTWAGVNTFIDGAGAVGAVPSIPGLFLAVPGQCGYTSGPLTGRLASECVRGKSPSLDLSVWSPTRAFNRTAIKVTKSPTRGEVGVFH